MNKLLACVMVVLTISATGSAVAQEKISLRESIGLALQNSQVVQVANENVTGAEYKIKENKSLYFPQINLGGSYTRMSLFSEMEFAFLGQTYRFKFGLPNNYDFRASAVQQVFNWGRTGKAIEMSRAGLDLARDGVALTNQLVAYQVVPLFYGVIFFREAIKVVDDNIKLFEKKLEIMTERYKAGLVSTFDLSTIEVQISMLRAQKIDFENNIHKLSLAFNSLAGRESETVFDPDGGLNPEEAARDKGALLKEAEALRVEFAQLQHQESLGRAGIDLARTANKPTVAFSFSYEFRNGYMPNMDTIRGNWSALLSVSYPLFDGFRANAQVAQAESALRTVQTRRADLQRSVALEIETALADLQSTEQKLKIEQLKIKQAEDALRIAEERYQRGMLSATDFVESQNAVGSAKLNQLQLVYNHILGTYSLYRAAGKKIYE